MSDTEKEIMEKLMFLSSSGIALSETTLQSILTLFNAFGIDETTDNTLLIKDTTTVSKIKNALRDVDKSF